MLSAAHCVSGSGYNYFKYLLDHPNAGEEPSHSGTESRKVEKNPNVTENKYQSTYVIVLNL